MSEKILAPAPPAPEARTESRRPLPKSGRGTIHRQYVRCGKSGCRCASGAPHGPYQYLFWRERGTLRKRYIPPADLEAVREACEDRRRQNEQMRHVKRACELQQRSVLPLLRRLEALRRGR